MRSTLLAAFLLLASSASAQNIWQMNSAIQNQYNQAYQSATPYYVPAYRPVYAPRYASPRCVAPVGSFERNLSRWSAEQDQLREMRQTNFTLRMMEWDLQDIANRRR